MTYKKGIEFHIEKNLDEHKAKSKEVCLKAGSDENPLLSSKILKTCKPLLKTPPSISENMPLNLPRIQSTAAILHFRKPNAAT